MRARVRRQFFRVLEQAFETDDGRRLLADALRGTGDDAAARATLTTYPAQQPYPDLGHPEVRGGRPTPVFITARFRSGSTLLWNLFRHVPRCTAYYEPLNERRWFDPATRGDRVDRTHGVSDYWREYDGLAHLGRWYQEHWINRHLYKDASFWDPLALEPSAPLGPASPRSAFSRGSGSCATGASNVTPIHSPHAVRSSRGSLQRSSSTRKSSVEFPASSFECCSL